jgi:uncharacterized integral membrane protein
VPHLYEGGMVMPWRLIQFIVVFVIFLLFIGFNLDNKCDINFSPNKEFMVLPQVPVYFTVFCSFIIGMLCTLPFVLSSKMRKKTDAVQGKGLFAKIAEKKNKKTNSQQETHIPKETTPHNTRDTNLSEKDYGID